MCVTRNSKGLQCTMSLPSYAAPLDDETVASSGKRSIRLGYDEKCEKLPVK